VYHRFGVDKPEELGNVQHTWIAEVIKQCPWYPNHFSWVEKGLREDELATGEKSGILLAKETVRRWPGCVARENISNALV